MDEIDICDEICLCTNALRIFTSVPSGNISAEIVQSVTGLVIDRLEALMKEMDK